MVNSNYKSLGSILWSVLKNPLVQEISYDDAAEYALECIKLLGAPVIYLEQVDEKVLTSYKTELPCNLLYINSIKYVNDNLEIAMREASDIFHMDSENLDVLENNLHSITKKEYTYKIQNGILFTSEENGCVKISYKAIAVDEDGYPLIPDNQVVALAIEYYILSRYLEPLWLSGKIPDKAYNYILQKRYFYVPSAQNDCQLPTIDKMETIMNGINRLIVNTTAHKNSFKNYGEKEIIRRFR